MWTPITHTIGIHDPEDLMELIEEEEISRVDAYVRAIIRVLASAQEDLAATIEKVMIQAGGFGCRGDDSSDHRRYGCGGFG